MSLTSVDVAIVVVPLSGATASRAPSPLPREKNPAVGFHRFTTSANVTARWVFDHTLKTAFEIPGVDAAINNAINTSMMAYSIVASSYLLNTLVVFENTLKTAFEIPGVDAAINNAIKTSMMTYSIVLTHFCHSLQPSSISLIPVTIVSYR